MGDASEKGLDAGFSDEEKEDLDTLIAAFNKDRKLLDSEASVDNLMQQVDTISKRFSQLGDIVSKTNKRLDAFYEIIQLMYRKSEIMNDRLNTLISELQKDADIIME